MRRMIRFRSICFFITATNCEQPRCNDIQFFGRHLLSVRQHTRYPKLLYNVGVMEVSLIFFPSCLMGRTVRKMCGASWRTRVWDCSSSSFYCSHLPVQKLSYAMYIRIKYSSLRTIHRFLSRLCERNSPSHALAVILPS